MFVSLSICWLPSNVTTSAVFTTLILALLLGLWVIPLSNLFCLNSPTKTHSIVLTSILVISPTILYWSSNTICTPIKDVSTFLDGRKEFSANFLIHSLNSHV